MMFPQLTSPHLHFIRVGFGFWFGVGVGIPIGGETIATMA